MIAGAMLVIALASGPEALLNSSGGSPTDGVDESGAEMT